MSFVLSVVNQKGGVGKTTTTINLASYLAARGKKTLLVDLDPQGNATSGLGLNKENEKSSYDLLINNEPVESIVQKTTQKNLFILPSTIDLAGAEVELAQVENREMRLKTALQNKELVYDYILIDCPPSLGFLTLNSIIASDGLILPVQAEYYALEGLSQLLSTLELVKENFDAHVEIFGILLTMYDARTILAQQVKNELRTHFSSLLFATSIPRNIRLSEAPSFGQSIRDYDPKSKGAEAYHALAREVIKKTPLFLKKGEK